MRGIQKCPQLPVSRMAGHGGTSQSAITLAHEANYYAEALEHMPLLEAVRPMSGPGDMVFERRELLVYLLRDAVQTVHCLLLLSGIDAQRAFMVLEVTVYLARSRRSNLNIEEHSRLPSIRWPRISSTDVSEKDNRK